MRITHAGLGSLFDCSVSWETGAVDITTHYCNHTPNHVLMQLGQLIYSTEELES